jgi:2-polyprenyl-3-methyl-5-hydroxy-6-metoxy-1,4-benzoquinol methylase
MRIDADTLREMATLLSTEDRDEMAIPSFLHKNPALRWMAWRRIEVVAQVFEEVCPPGGRVLDFGCGTGVLFEAALGKASEVIGVDLVLTAANLWKQRKNLERVKLLSPEEAKTAIEPGSVDVIIAAEVLEHIEEPKETLDFFRNVLSPKGTLLVSLPTENRAYRFGRRLAGFDGHFHVHNAASLDTTIRAHGFVCEQSRYIPMPGPLSIYLVARYSKAA